MARSGLHHPVPTSPIRLSRRWVRRYIAAAHGPSATSNTGCEQRAGDGLARIAGDGNTSQPMSSYDNMLIQPNSLRLIHEL
jgi:hypothetical protein